MNLPRVPEPEVMDTVEEAVDYDSMQHGTVNRQFVDDLQKFCASVSRRDALSGRILDLGTGTAQIPVRLFESLPGCGGICACDLSMEMLKLAERNIASARAQSRITAHYCDAKNLPFGNRSFDVVMSNSIVHHIPDPLTVFREMRRVIRTDGIVFVRDLLRPDSLDTLDHLVETYAGGENPHQRQMFRDSLHAALTIAEVQTLLSESGFRSDLVMATSDRHWTIAGLINETP